jgi:hypothetical protein
VIINSSEEPISDFDFRDVKPFTDKETGNSVCAVGTFNKSLFHMNYDIDDCDHSCLELKVFPQ